MKITGVNLPYIELLNPNTVDPKASVQIIWTSTSKTGPPVRIKSNSITEMQEFDRDHRVFRLESTISPLERGAPVLSLKGDVIGFADTQIIKGEAMSFVIPTKYARELLSKVDQTAPLFQWRGSSGELHEKSIRGISGYWKSNNGNVYLVVDKGLQVKIINMSAPKFRYEARWRGDLIVGIGYNDDTKRFALKLVNPNYMIRSVFKFSKGESDEGILLKAQQEIKKPDDGWSRILQ
ncbi:MAG: hypothetical protein H0W99_12610 [Acidobacteria bacterium]|nr:hypothetical protein [Acidobacteriota bacterium]